MGPVQLGPTISSLVGNILNQRTRQIYAQAWQSLKRFALSVNVMLTIPISEDMLLSYIAFLNIQGYAASTIVAHISAFSFVHKMNKWTNPADSFVISRVLKRLQANKQPDARKPMTIELLSRICANLPYIGISTYEAALFQCMFIVAFTAMLRVSEITSGNRCNHNIQFQYVSLSDNLVSIKLVSYKHSNNPVTLLLKKSDNSSVVCPVLAIKKYLSYRTAPRQGPFFVHSNGSAVSRATFNNRLKDSLMYSGDSTDHMSSHSFRIGGATHLAQRGFSDDEIKRLGRWKSNALVSYIRFPSLQVGSKPTECVG
jgi:site-specific recombinase XerD